MATPAHSPLVLRSSYLATCVAAFALSALAGPTKSTITLEQTAGRGGRIQFNSSLKQYRFDSDGALLSDGGKRLDPKTLAELPAKAVDPKAAGSEASKVERLDRDATVAALSKLSAIGKDKAVSLVDGARATYEPAEIAKTRLVLSDGGAFYVKGDTAKVVIESGGAPIELPTFVKATNRVVFVRGNDLFAIDLVDGSLTRITDTGSSTILNGKLDWVYQEEVYGRSKFTGYFPSGDGKHLAFLTLDEGKVFDFPIVDPITQGDFRGRLELMKYPKAGDPNPSVKLSLYDVIAKKSVPVDLGKYASDEPIVAVVTFTPDSKLCLAVIQDRRQTYADLIAIDPSTGEWKPWIHEGSKSWVDRPDEPRWLNDGGFLWMSQRTGYLHVYRYLANGGLQNAVTTGDGSVASILDVDEKAGELWFIGKKDGAINKNLYRCRLDGSGLTRITQGDGTHNVELAPDKQYLLDTFSSLTQPPAVSLCDRDGKVLRVLDESKVSNDYEIAKWQLMPVKARDGVTIDAAFQKPIDFDATASYPIWITTYSGPAMPTLSNRWSVSAWNQFLAQNGVIVMMVNVRSASDAGQCLTESCYRQLGKQELMDIEDAIAALATNPWADGGRVGITGYSYGGFMTAYAMTHSDKFALGIAGGGVYDWRMYDTIYTERYMDLPKNNAAGYDASSVIKAAKNLHGHLLFHHGVNDDNVHLQNALQFVYALEKADKSFEFMPYPESGHGIGDRDLAWHNRQLEWKEIDRYLVHGRPTRN